MVLTEHDRVLFDAEIRTQSKRRKLYLLPEIETALSHIESNTAACFHSIISAPKCFSELRFNEAEVFMLAGAISLQATRLPQVGQARHDAMQPLFQCAFECDASKDPTIPESVLEELRRGDIVVDYDYRYDVLEAIHVALIGSVLFFDLTPILLVNSTPIPFVFSDAPAVLTNRLLWDHRNIQGVTGLSTPGLIATLPINESLAILFFDGGAYEVAGESGGIIILFDVADVGLLNAMQAHTAQSAIYFGRHLHAEYVQRLDRMHRPVVVRNRQVVRKAYSEDGTSELIHQFEMPPNVLPSLSFMSVRATANRNANFQPRNRQLIDTVEVAVTNSRHKRESFTQEAFESMVADCFKSTSELRNRL